MTTLQTVGLVIALGLAFSFEFVNGFHDTANAVATVIYTRTLPPWIAVVWSGCWNLIGVLLSSGAVAFGIVALLPVELVIHVGSGAGFAMVFAMLTSAIIWNLGTWYLGLPASSSHTLIGSIVGVGLANSLMQPGHVFGDGVNWGKVQDTALALLISPIIGFFVAGGLLLLAKAVIRYPVLFQEPPEGQAPPWPVRTLLFLTCTGVSFAHGSNDGQKGMGLVMLILIGIIPGYYALNPDIKPAQIQSIATASKDTSAIITKHAGSALIITKPRMLASLETPADVVKGAAPADDSEQKLSDYIKQNGKLTPDVFAALKAKNDHVAAGTTGKTSFSALDETGKKDLRTDAYLVSATLAKMVKKNVITDSAELATVKGYTKALDGLTKFIPTWVKVAIAFALGLGTMIGWKRIVVTVGERIGKTHLTYGQGAAAEIVAYATIQAADIYGLPVSTTHILSSGIAGTMAANGSGLQAATMRNILLAWVLTLPVCVLLGSMLFAGGLLVVARLGVH